MAQKRTTAIDALGDEVLFGGKSASGPGRLTIVSPEVAWILQVSFPIPVGAPFPYIADHFVKTVDIGFEGAERTG